MNKKWFAKVVAGALFVPFEAFLLQLVWNQWLTPAPLNLPHIGFQVAYRIIIVVLILTIPAVFLFGTETK